jgi:hypothetical protein
LAAFNFTKLLHKICDNIVLFNTYPWWTGYHACHWTQVSWVQTQLRTVEFKGDKNLTLLSMKDILCWQNLRIFLAKFLPALLLGVWWMNQD